MLSTRAVRWSAHFIWLCLLGLLPATVALLLASRQPGPWPLLEAEARGRARLFDAKAEQWLGSVRDRAAELSALLSQLPEGTLGKASEATILLFLERRLAAQREMMDRFVVLDPTGRMLLQSGGSGARNWSGDIEVAQAAARPALVLSHDRAASRAGELLAAAPVLQSGKLIALFAGQVNRQQLVPLFSDLPPRWKASLVDAGGTQVGEPLPGADLGSVGRESRGGRTRLNGWLAAFAPLESTRAALVVASPPTTWLSGFRMPYALAVLLALVAAGLAATKLTRVRRAVDTNAISPDR